MAIIKAKDAAKMTQNERNEKLKELKTELIKARLSNKKTTKLNAREIKRTIARLLTFNNANKEKIEVVKKEDKKAEVKKSVKKGGQAS
jgi:ribosomal protein L29